MTVLAGETGGEDTLAFLGGRPSRDGPGPADCRCAAFGVASNGQLDVRIGRGKGAGQLTCS